MMDEFSCDRASAIRRATGWRPAIGGERDGDGLSNLGTSDWMSFCNGGWTNSSETAAGVHPSIFCKTSTNGAGDTRLGRQFGTLAGNTRLVQTIGTGTNKLGLRKIPRKTP
ncbi:unnamed protein product [Cuscuta campestris]|uniref:Uncharacterized protein n=1 Tax=Cuscuta campestris TaxID=132261 RepID=A0A484NRW9_9ASTE|nr:unnamed protein product [Cuscuta campestris]